MTRVVFVGEMYNADLSVGGGPVYPPIGVGGDRPVDPGYSPPWARPRPPYVDNTLPQPPLGIWGPPGPWPSLPIAPGGPPLGIWGGGNVPMPNPPIYFPPEPGTPAHPIVLPPDLPPTTPEGRPIEWKTGWTAATGWIVVGIPQVPVPTPA